MVAAMVKLRVGRYALAEIMSDKANIMALVETQFSVGAIHDTNRLLEQLLERIFNLIPAERGAVLFAGRKPNSLDCVAFRSALPDVSPVITEEVMTEYTAVLDDASSAGTSLLCAPLRVFDSVLGVIYLESSKPGAFSPKHLQLLIAIACATAISLVHTRLIGRLESENQRLHEEIAQEHSANLEIIGDSPRMREVRRFIGKVAPTDSTVLILGPSGTGKELVARAIHKTSKRADGPFVAVNCGAIPANLVESELFGYEKGAFTGATARQAGKIEVADGGTLFLDEVGELAMTTQAALLRALQEREFYRVGGTKLVSVDVRIVAATNRDLEERIKEDRFREDLYFRLKVVQIEMPSLCECREDIPLLASHFLQKFLYTRITKGFSSEAQRILQDYHWRGNVRELENVVRHALTIGETDAIQPEDLPEYLTTAQSPESAPAGSFHAQIRALKKAIVERALAEAKGNYTEAAKKLGVSPSYFRRLVLDMKIDLR